MPYKTEQDKSAAPCAPPPTCPLGFTNRYAQVVMALTSHQVTSKLPHSKPGNMRLVSKGAGSRRMSESSIGVLVDNALTPPIVQHVRADDQDLATFRAGTVYRSGRLPPDEEQK